MAMDPIDCDSTTGDPAVLGTNLTGTGPGVLGESKNFNGVWGISHDPHNAGVLGTNDGNGWGVTGRSATQVGVSGESQSGLGVHGISVGSIGVQGESTSSQGVYGLSHDPHNAGVLGINDGGGWGVTGRSANQVGVSGESQSGLGVHGISVTSAGVQGESTSLNGVSGLSHDPHNAGVFGYNDNGGWGVTGRSSNVGVSGECLSGTGVGVHGKGGVLAGLFEGDIKVLGEIYAQGPSAARFVGPVQITGNVELNGSMTVQSGGDVVFADFAEHFDSVPGQTLPPGAVVVLTETGHIQPCETEYDTRVVGVISGAGKYRPAMVLDRRAGEVSEPPVALMGKVYCMADATDSPIKAGDLLTSSSRPGHAMGAGDRARRTGAIIGKALQPLASGVDLIPILVTLQ